ncbi:MAG TPA: polyketide synthase [Cyanobacteria bacterium UBA11149]|nr:polyketide synthase [Cyanobacteria bacterium UBA11367]HBE59907.1 polyketide synthase [Cyanobacteria bacterium UBA11366]HBK64710.1 polyketide synthase [Cyanobacteria bacterium UBA11166]HBR75863.1 polyketide synthase [Cyanobacteria bacterium UBA11159]HBS69285.1 polyketide synthase [Cyanobacteria bacterium UBA11153]HBW90438.1 polyketide synthase [Cyanobacteria bacterium UBA11149]HCA96640.1 polyketide synthase [Cyanobacteria bacterium UBA9226]
MLNTLDLTTEAILDEAIQFSQPLSDNIANPRGIFLTGATGFVGAYLLEELLEKTTGDIYCLVRCSEKEAGKQRLRSHLQFYQLWQDKFCDRIIPLVGDLSQPLLGLSEEQFSQLASQIDIIYHNGAKVNSVAPYSQLKPPNVLGTQEVLRLASIAKTKPVNFISSIAVFFSQAYGEADIVKETDIPVWDSGFKGGYKQSKWVAEKLVTIAQERGLPVSIYRAARILGHSKTGITGNLQDLLCSLIKGCIQFGKFPLLDGNTNITPVDYISKSIVYLSQQPESLGKTFHVVNPHPIPWQELFEEIIQLGYPLAGLPYEKWLIELKNHAFAHKDNALYPLLPLLLSSASALKSKKPDFDDSNTRAGLAKSEIVCHPVDKQLLTTYFSYFQNSGYLPLS